MRHSLRTLLSVSLLAVSWLAACSSAPNSAAPDSADGSTTGPADGDGSDDGDDGESGEQTEDAGRAKDAARDAKTDAKADAAKKDAKSCVPDCTDKVCGDDGCGGQCGSCGSNDICKDGKCLAANYCASTDWYSDYCKDGCCPGATHHRYRYLGTNGFGGDAWGCTCSGVCMNPGNSGDYCSSNADCCPGSHCSIYTTPGFAYGLGHCSEDPGTTCNHHACTASGTSAGCCQWTPYCGGTSGCRAYLGTEGDACADDAACESGRTCVGGHCHAPCTPSCSGKQCGSDGCGGSCGQCASNENCSGNTCIPQCVPSCAGKDCGSDGCGGSCGQCGSNEVCSGNSCVSAGVCDPVTNTGCTSGNECWVLAAGNAVCAVPGAGHQGASCSTTGDCDGGFGCFDVCRKICNKQTGSGCALGEQCAGVTGWTKYGACQ